MYEDVALSNCYTNTPLQPSKSIRTTSYERMHIYEINTRNNIFSVKKQSDELRFAKLSILCYQPQKSIFRCI